MFMISNYHINFNTQLTQAFHYFFVDAANCHLAKSVVSFIHRKGDGSDVQVEHLDNRIGGKQKMLDIKISR